jgi:hypothetical protein
MNIFKKIIKEEYIKLNEVSNELHDLIKSNYSDKRITISRTVLFLIEIYGNTSQK